jgi:hypothetical protein
LKIGSPSRGSNSSLNSSCCSLSSAATLFRKLTVNFDDVV